MSDIERYLSELRAHLTDLHPKRADEIVTEVRTHLESRAAQLRAGGMSEEDASAEAARTFGDPSQVAQDLVRGNTRHRRPIALRALAAITITLGAAFALAGLYATPECWNSPSLHFIAHYTGLDLEPAAFLLLLIQLLPAAYLAGIVGGPRFWWLAGAPGAFWIGLCWIPSLVSGNLPPSATLPHQLRYALIVPGLAALVLAATGRLGAHLAASRSPVIRGAAHTLAVICSVYAVSLGLVALGRALDSPEAQSLAAVVAVPVALAFLVAARKDHRLPRRRFLILFSAVPIAALLAVGAIALLLASLGVSSSAFGNAFLWLTVTAIESVLGLLAARIYWRRTQPESAPHGRDLSPE